MVYGNLGSVNEPYASTDCDTKLCKFNVEKVYFFKKVSEDRSSLTLIKTSGLNITYLSEEIG